MAYYCLQNLQEKTTSNLIYFVTAQVSEQFALFRCSLTRKFTMFNSSYVSCIILVGVREIIYYHLRGSRDVKGWETLL
jgi:hypothetical protein